VSLGLRMMDLGQAKAAATFARELAPLPCLSWKA